MPRFTARSSATASGAAAPSPTGRAGDFELIRRFFSPREEPPAYRDAAAEFGVSIPKLKSLLHRARLWPSRTEPVTW